MKLALTALLLSSALWGQVYSSGGPVVNNVGQPVAAQIAVCTTQPSLPNPPTTNPPNCSVYATTYTDATLGSACTLAPTTLGPISGVGCTNPGKTDSRGNYVVFAPSNIYYLEFYGYGITTYIMPASTATTAGNFSSPPPIGNVTPNTGQFTTLNSINTDALSSVTAIADYLTSLVNGLNITTEIRSQTTNGMISAIAGGVLVPNTSTAYQVNGLMGILNTASISTNAVGVYGQCRATASNTFCWGANNLVISDNSGLSNVTLIGLENDMTVNNATDRATAFSAAGYWRAQAAVSTGFVVGKPAGGTWHWDNGYSTTTGCCTYAAVIASTSATAGSPSMPILFEHVDAGGSGRPSTIFVDPNGAINLHPWGGTATGNYVIINPAGPYGVRLTPDTDTQQIELYGSNAANSAIDWKIYNSGYAVFNGPFDSVNGYRVNGSAVINNVGQFISLTTNPALSGEIRLAKTDTINFRNNANSGDLPLGIDGSDNLTYNSKIVPSNATAPVVNTAVCWKDVINKVLGYCSTALSGTPPTCTCN